MKLTNNPEILIRIVKINSLSKEAEEKISKLKGQIAEEIQGNNLNKTNGVINHNLRLN